MVAKLTLSYTGPIEKLDHIFISQLHIASPDISSPISYNYKSKSIKFLTELLRAQLSDIQSCYTDQLQLTWRWSEFLWHQFFFTLPGNNRAGFYSKNNSVKVPENTTTIYATWKLVTIVLSEPFSDQKIFCMLQEN